MAQAPSYNDIRTRKAEQQVMQQQAGQQQAMRQDLDNQANAGKNAVLQEYMNRQAQPQPGLGEINPAAYSRAQAQAQVDPRVAEQDMELLKIATEAIQSGRPDVAADMLDKAPMSPGAQSELAIMLTQFADGPGLGPIR